MDHTCALTFCGKVRGTSVPINDSNGLIPFGPLSIPFLNMLLPVPNDSYLSCVPASREDNSDGGDGGAESSWTRGDASANMGGGRIEGGTDAGPRPSYPL